MSAITKITTSLKKFHNNEEGLEALQVVMIIAVAALALLIVKSRWSQISTWFQQKVDEVIKWV